MQKRICSAKKGVHFQLCPLIETHLADTETPISLFLKLGKPNACLLESVEGEERIARFSYIALEPFAIFQAWLSGRRELSILDEQFERLEALLDDSLPIPEQVQILLDAFSSPTLPNRIKMATSGAFGFIGYDAAAFIEKLPVPSKELPCSLPDIWLGFYDTLVVFDNVARKVALVTNYTSEHYRAAAEEKLCQLKQQLTAALNLADITLSKEQPEAIVSNLSREAYLQKVQRAKDYIFAGDVFQVQISQRLERRLNAKPFDVYRALRTINPSPYCYYFDLGSVQIIGSSPELLVSVTSHDGKRWVETRPIAGTRPRGETIEADIATAKDLLGDEKERAEHLMLIDLSRNDIGRIAKIGSVTVTEQMVIERYSHVMHLVSNVRGELREELSPLDAFWSCFPAGTLTGAPKIRAMEIIYELEQERRGLYGGAIGYIDFQGNLKMAIAIRTMIAQQTRGDARIYLQAAAGIVADSKPEKEYEETLSKMKAGLRALDMLITHH